MSRGLFYLTDREFSLIPANQQGGLLIGEVANSNQQQQQFHLVHRVPDVCVVFFYSVSCPICKTLINEFKSLPGKVQGVNFALANVSANNMRIQQMSEASQTPIRYVPYIVVYIEGKYYLEYRGPKNIDSIARAAYEIAMKIRSGQDFSQGKVCSSKNGAAGYCVDGYDQDQDEDMCYTYTEAYGGGDSNGSSGKVCDAKSGKCYTYAEAYGGSGMNN